MMLIEKADEVPSTEEKADEVLLLIIRMGRR